jgi:hypothetical protein
VTCRIDAFQATLASAGGDALSARLHRRLEHLATLLRVKIEAGGVATGKRQRRLLKGAERRARTLLAAVKSGLRRRQIAPDVAEALRAAADGALGATQRLRQGLSG